MTRYSKHINIHQTPQSEAIPGREKDMVQNSAGGFAFPVNDWSRVERFLVLGSEGGSYYAKENKLTKENAQAVTRCIAEDGERVVEMAVDISKAGRAPKNDPAIFVLAMCAKLGGIKTKQAAYLALPEVCRIGTHLFHWCADVQNLGGWGAGTRRAVSRWYNGKRAKDVAFQAVKYQSRDGWSHRDVLRLAHVKPKSPDHDLIYKWAVGKLKDVPQEAEASRIIWAFETAKSITDVKQMCAFIDKYQLPREAIPTEMLNHAAIWEVLLPHMGLTALIRNLATMTRVGLIAPMSSTLGTISQRITDEEQIKKARVHPIQFLSALMTYRAGHGLRGKNTWNPQPQVIDALSDGFYKSFGFVEPTNKRHYVALDVSGSMDAGDVAGVPGLTPRVASSAMAMVRCRVEKAWLIKGFTGGMGGTWLDVETHMQQLTISPKQRMDDILIYTNGLPFGRTDCALPMVDALKNKIPVDVFEVYTDSETWCGSIHPMQALKEYRNKMGIAAKMVVVGMVSNGFSISDPEDGGCIDVVGFDTATPNVISDFVKG